MMSLKAGVVFLTICVFSITQNAAKPSETKVSKDTLKEAAMVIVNDCKKQANAKDEDVEALKLHQMPKSHEGLCMLECLFNTGKIMQEGKLHKEGAVEFFTPGLKDDQDKIEKMKAMLDVCEKEIGQVSDSCQVPKLIIECTLKHGKDFGFTFPNHLKM